MGVAVGGDLFRALEDDRDDLGVGRDLQRHGEADEGAVAGADELPVEAKDAIYLRMWQVLSNENRRLSSADRKAIVEILRDTKKDLPSYFREM